MHRAALGSKLSSLEAESSNTSLLKEGPLFGKVAQPYFRVYARLESLLGRHRGWCLAVSRCEFPSCFRR